MEQQDQFQINGHETIFYGKRFIDLYHHFLFKPNS
jgi:hypothetical protein